METHPGEAARAHLLEAEWPMRARALAAERGSARTAPWRRSPVGRGKGQEESSPVSRAPVLPPPPRRSRPGASQRPPGGTAARSRASPLPEARRSADAPDAAGSRRSAMMPGAVAPGAGGYGIAAPSPARPGPRLCGWLHPTARGWRRARCRMGAGR